MEVKAIAFDLDGTLYPNYRLNIRLTPFVLKHWRLLIAFGKAREQIRKEQEELSSPAVSSPALFYDYQAQITADLLKAPMQSIREKIDSLIYCGWERHFFKIKLFPKVKEVLDKLKTAQFKLGLLSDFPAETKINNLGLGGYWDAVVSSEKTGALKPALQPFTELSQALQCPSEQILYVGNNRRCDVFGAKRAGMKTALLVKHLAQKTHSDDQAKADFFFNDYRQLYNFVLQ
ncbi:MAG: HAD family hydrolase [Treponema sp.]|nr:HAD family hydrolase [Treponema sp.]